MRSAPALYMTTVLGFVLEDGAAILHRFIAAWFVAPLFAGYLADRDVDEPPGP
jgi:dipeptide/tripeptide permease